MKTDIKTLTQITYVVLAGLMFLPSTSAGQDAYPARPVHFIVGLAAGSSTDVTARVIANKMTQILGQQFVVENRPGASGNIAAGFVANAPKDGYTLLLGSVATAINVSLFHNQSFDLVRDFEPVTLLATVSNILLVHRSLGVHNLDELIALAKAKPGEIFYASSGIGTSSHLSAEMFNSMANVRLVHVPYQGSSQAMSDFIAGRTSVIFTPAPTAVSLMKMENVVALASTQLKRAGIAPDLPTIDELGLKGFDTGTWYGLYSPKGAPKQVIATLSHAANEALRSEDVLTAFKPQGIDALGGTPEQFGSYLHSEIDKWADVVQKEGLKQ
jgi:tripartite-type tricarboxylate transporter receptor subunit TctC